MEHWFEPNAPPIDLHLFVPAVPLTKNIIRAGFGLALAVLLAGTVLVYLAESNALEVLRRVNRTREVQSLLDRLVTALTEAESSSRGFVATGEVRFIQVFEPTVAEVARLQRALWAFLDEDQAQRQRLQALEPLIREKVEGMRLNITERRATEHDLGGIQRRLLEGLERMQKIRALVGQLDAYEDELLRTSGPVVEEQIGRSMQLTGAASLVALALVTLAGWKVLRDFDEGRLVLKDLETSRDYAENIVDTVREPLLVVDEELRIQGANRSYYQAFGHRREEVETWPLFRVADGVWNNAELKRALETTLAGGGRFIDLEVACEFPDKGTRIMLFNGRRLSLPGPKQAAALLAMEDITERRKAEAELRKSAEQIYDLYNRAPCGYHSLNRRGVYLQVNDTELSWLGYSREEMLGKIAFPDLMTPESRHRFGPIFSQFWQTGSVSDLEFEIVRKDGTRMTVLLNATAVRDESGKYSATRATMYDITARKQADRELHALNEELRRHAALTEVANKELEGFSYSVSHDLRAPLRHIGGFAEMLLKNAGDKLDATGLRYVRVISDSARRMGALIDELLVFSRRSRTEMQLRETPLGELVDEVITQLAPETKDRNVVWKKGELPVVQADPSLLGLVFTNLLSNAVKYTRPRDPALIEIWAEDSGSEVQISVRDNGVGFDMAYAHKLFGVFQRLHRNEEFEGTGIGLANVQKIVSRHGGRVWGEARLDEGATFSFTLPSPQTKRSTAQQSNHS